MHVDDDTEPTAEHRAVGHVALADVVEYYRSFGTPVALALLVTLLGYVHVAHRPSPQFVVSSRAFCRGHVFPVQNRRPPTAVGCLQPPSHFGVAFLNSSSCVLCVLFDACVLRCMLFLFCLQEADWDMMAFVAYWALHVIPLAPCHSVPRKQRPCPSNTRRWFHQFLVIYRCSDKAGGGAIAAALETLGLKPNPPPRAHPFVWYTRWFVWGA